MILQEQIIPEPEERVGEHCRDVSELVGSETVRSLLSCVEVEYRTDRSAGSQTELFYMSYLDI